MRPTQLKTTLHELFQIRRTTCIEGPPGGGKTTIVRSIAEELNIGYIEKHMPTMLVEDFGVPDMATKKEVFKYKLPDWFPAVERKDIPEQGILCFDDRNQAPPDLQKVLANICQARELHGARLKPGWMIVSTGNRQTDRSGAHKVLLHLRDRETVLELETNVDDFTTWAASNGVGSEVIGFVQFRPSLLHDFNTNQENNPTPRSWVEGVDAVLNVVSKENEYSCFKGAVGEGAAVEFCSYLKIHRELPDIPQMIKNAEKAKIPEDAVMLYALSSALSEYITEENHKNVFTLMNKMPQEFSVLCALLFQHRSPEMFINLLDTPEYEEWVQKNKSAIFTVMDT